MVMTDRTGKIVLVNAEVERLFGYSREELLDHSVDMLVPEGARAGHAARRNTFAAWPEARRMGIGRDLYGRRKDGTQFPIEIGLNPIQTDDGLLILSAITDLTERKAAEERFRRVVENSPIAKMMTDQNGTIMLVNIATERLLGYRRDELIGKSIEILVPPRIRGGHINFRKAFDAHPEVRLMGKSRDLSIVRKDGTELPVEIGLNPIQMADGMMVLSAIVDISERQEAIRNLAAQREELQRSNADLEQFAYVASHDLQEPLRMVATYAELLAERYQGNLDERADKYIKYTVDGARRMQQLIKELLEYSRVSSNAKVPIQIESALVVEYAIQALKVAIDESGADVAHDKLPAVRADQAQLGQVFQNLLGNAIKFHGDRPPRIRICAEQRNGKCVFRVEDNGIGIDKQYADRVFQMFQRLHERGQYEGNGIGLAIVKKIVERHGGHIWFESEPGCGTTFYFTIPSA